MTPGVFKKNNVNITGNPDAPETIIFGHGFGIDQTSFNAVLPYFEADYKIILFDNVGGGKADIAAYSAERYQNLEAYASDLLDICRLLNVQDAIYVGHSVSGMTGLLACIRAPQYFSKLVLLGASPRYLNDDSVGYVGGFNQQALDSLYEAMSTNYHAWASGFSKLAMANPDRPQLAAAFAESLSVIRPDIALRVAKTIFESDYRKDLPRLTKPALVVQTTNDIAVPEVVGDYLHQHIPQSSLVKVHVHGHFPHVSAPHEVALAIKAFIQPVVNN